MLLLLSAAAAATTALTTSPPIASCISMPAVLSASLSARGFVTATPIQQAALGRAATGESLLLHAETGSGKTLALLLPALCRSEGVNAMGNVLVLSPTRELAVQLGDEASELLNGMDDPSVVGTVCLVAQGHPATIAQAMNARVTVATPAEFCQLLSGADAGKFVDALAASVSTVILDEVDALIPGKKAFRGKRHSKWMDKDMHPAEAIVKMFARRSDRADFQVLAASATLDRSTRRKLVKLLRQSPVLQESVRGASALLPIVSTLIAADDPADAAPAAILEPRISTATVPGCLDDSAAESVAEPLSRDEQVRRLIAQTEAAEAAAEAAQLAADMGLKVERWTAVPSVIDHRTVAISKGNFDGSDGTKTAAEAAKQVFEAREKGSALLFVSSRSTYLGGAHSVCRQLRSLGVDAHHLSDAIWPSSTRARKRTHGRAGGGRGDGASSAQTATNRRAALNSELAAGARRLLVADAAATRGLHLDGVTTVLVLGLPANADAYLHLAGRTGRWPRRSEAGAALVATIATEAELRTLRGWAVGLGDVEFQPFSADVD